jgi:hypothetical protein
MLRQPGLTAAHLTEHGWYDYYSRARDAMFAATDTPWALWYNAHTDDKNRGRLNIISHLLSQVRYKPLAHPDITLPKRQRPAAIRTRTCRLLAGMIGVETADAALQVRADSQADHIVSGAEDERMAGDDAAWMLNWLRCKTR